MPGRKHGRLGAWLALAPVVAAVALVAAGGRSAAQQGKSEPKAKPGGLVVAGEVGQALDAWMSSPKNFPSGFSGCVLVALDGQILLAKGYGTFKAADAEKGGAATPMPADAIWDWASVSKQFTSAAVLKLLQKKKLKLDDSIRKHFKDAPKDKEPVTIRHLLDHTSGIHDAADNFKGVDTFDREASVARILSLPLASEPGKKWEYSNTAYFLLGALIEKVGGTSYEKFLRDQLFEPAGMKDSGVIGDGKADHARVPFEEGGRGAQFAYGPRLSWGYRGAGGVLATVHDILKWDVALRGEKVLSKAEKQEYYEPVLNHYALGWFVAKGNGGTRVNHSGRVGHITTFFLRLLDEPVVVALATNVDPEKGADPGAWAEKLAEIARKSR